MGYDECGAGAAAGAAVERRAAVRPTGSRLITRRWYGATATAMTCCSTPLSTLPNLSALARPVTATTPSVSWPTATLKLRCGDLAPPSDPASLAVPLHPKGPQGQRTPDSPKTGPDR
jgi:hypothetical protein